MPIRGAMPETGTNVVGILQPGYLPWLGFFEQLFRCDVFVIYDDVQFEKGAWRNRNRIKTSSGPQWLTVPVLLKDKGFRPIRDIEVNTVVPWAKKHIKAITQNYSKAPFFPVYSDELFAILDESWEYLIDVDMAAIEWLSRQLGIKTKIHLASDLGVPGSNVERLIGIIKHLGGGIFYEGASGRDYIDQKEFEKAGIKVVFQEYGHPVYPQLYGDFISHLSVIDLLFNCGPEALSILAGLRDGRVN
jgi:hypothetical protein